MAARDEDVSIYSDPMFYRFALYGFLKNLKFYEVFIILYFISVGLSFTEIGFLLSVQMFTTVLMELPTGSFADAFGRKKAMVFSFLSYIASFLIFYFTGSFLTFAAAMVLYGTADALRTGTHKAMILDYLRLKGWSNRKVDYYGHTRASSQFGSAVNSLLAAGVVFYTGSYSVVFLLAIIPYLIDIINVGTYPKELDGEISSSTTTIKEKISVTAAEFRHMLSDRDARKGFLSSALFDGVFQVVKHYLQPILEAFALTLPVLLFLSGDKRTAVIVGLVYFLLYLLTSFASSRSGKALKRVGSSAGAVNATLLLGSAMVILAGFALALCDKFPSSYMFGLAILLFMGLYALMNIRRPLIVGYISDNISYRTMAQGLSVDSLLKTLLSGVMAPLIGLTADNMGIGAALALAGILMVLVYPAAAVKGKALS